MATDNTVKLSKTQKEVIRLLKEGKRLHYITGIYARCFFDINKGNVPWPTITKLESLKLIDRKDRYCDLTELGKTIIIK